MYSPISNSLCSAASVRSSHGFLYPSMLLLFCVCVTDMLVCNSDPHHQGTGHLPHLPILESSLLRSLSGAYSSFDRFRNHQEGMETHFDLQSLSKELSTVTSTHTPLVKPQTKPKVTGNNPISADPSSSQETSSL